MDKRKILFIIPCSERVYWKIQKAKNAAKEYAPFLFAGATIGAAWGAYCNSWSNSCKLDRVENAVNHNADVLDGVINVVNHNATNSEKRLKELERNQNELFKRALNITEGKEETPAE